MLERIWPRPSACRCTTAAAVSSQVVSMPRTSISISRPHGEEPRRAASRTMAACSSPRPSRRPPKARLRASATRYGGLLTVRRLAPKSRYMLARTIGRSGDAMRLLVTRPEPDATRSADALRLRGHEAIVAPLTRMETIATEFGGPFSAVLMTSANAARAVAQHPRLGDFRTLPLFTI